MKLKTISSISLLSVFIFLSVDVQAQPKVRRGGVYNNSGAAVGGFGIKGDKGQGGCLRMRTSGQAIARCQGNYNNSETGVSRSGSGSFRYDKGQLNSETQSSGTRANGSTFNRSTTGNYNLNQQTGSRTIHRQGTTQNGTDYDYEKNTSYSEGEFCRTVSLEAGTYQYNNSGQLSCQ